MLFTEGCGGAAAGGLLPPLRGFLVGGDPSPGAHAPGFTRSPLRGWMKRAAIAPKGRQRIAWGVSPRIRRQPRSKAPKGRQQAYLNGMGVRPGRSGVGASQGHQGHQGQQGQSQQTSSMSLVSLVSLLSFPAFAGAALAPYAGRSRMASSSTT